MYTCGITGVAARVVVCDSGLHMHSVLSASVRDKLLLFPRPEHVPDLRLPKAVERVKESDVHLNIHLFSPAVFPLPHLPHLFQILPSASSLWFSRQSCLRKPSLGPISLF